MSDCGYDSDMMIMEAKQVGNHFCTAKDAEGQFADKMNPVMKARCGEVASGIKKHFEDMDDVNTVAPDWRTAVFSTVEEYLKEVRNAAVGPAKKLPRPEASETKNWKGFVRMYVYNELVAPTLGKDIGPLKHTPARANGLVRIAMEKAILAFEFAWTLLMQVSTSARAVGRVGAARGQQRRASQREAEEERTPPLDESGVQGSLGRRGMHTETPRRRLSSVTSAAETHRVRGALRQPAVGPAGARMSRFTEMALEFPGDAPETAEKEGECPADLLTKMLKQHKAEGYLDEDYVKVMDRMKAKASDPANPMGHNEATKHMQTLFTVVKFLAVDEHCAHPVDSVVSELKTSAYAWASASEATVTVHAKLLDHVKNMLLAGIESNLTHTEWYQVCDAIEGEWERFAIDDAEGVVRNMALRARKDVASLEEYWKPYANWINATKFAERAAKAKTLIEDGVKASLDTSLTKLLDVAFAADEVVPRTLERAVKAKKAQASLLLKARKGTEEREEQNTMFWGDEQNTMDWSAFDGPVPQEVPKGRQVGEKEKRADIPRGVSMGRRDSDCRAQEGQGIEDAAGEPASKRTKVSLAAKLAKAHDDETCTTDDEGVTAAKEAASVALAALAKAADAAVAVLTADVFASVADDVIIDSATDVALEAAVEVALEVCTEAAAEASLDITGVAAVMAVEAVEAAVAKKAAAKEAAAKEAAAKEATSLARAIIGEVLEIAEAAISYREAAAKEAAAAAKAAAIQAAAARAAAAKSAAAAAAAAAEAARTAAAAAAAEARAAEAEAAALAGDE